MNVRPVVSQLLRVTTRQNAINSASLIGVRNSSAYKAPAHHKPAHYDELPLPQGSWQTQHDLQQKKYNLHLIVGLTMLLGTITFVKASGLIFFNYEYPPIPEGGFK